MNKFLLLFVIVTFFSCGEAKWETKEFNGYTMELPDYLTEANGINEEAEVQYQNVIREVYLVVIRESKADTYGYTFDSYCDFVKNNVKEVTVGEFENEEHVRVNNMSSLQFEAFEDLDGTMIYYFIGVFESENNFYQVLAWTLKSRMDEYKPDLKRMVNSLKEK